MNGSSRVRAWRGYIGLSLAWLAVLGAVLLVTRRPASQPIEILPPFGEYLIALVMRFHNIC